MIKFNKVNVAGLLGPASIASVTDAEIWNTLLTPMTRALLGRIVWSRQVEVRETVEGLFPGDMTSNLNDHLLYGGQSGFVRFPYLHSYYKSEYGLFVIKRDFVKLEVFCWYGDPERGPVELVFKSGLRDRRFDGTRRADDSALVDYRYDDPEKNPPPPPATKVVEMSTYGFLPNSKIVDVDGDMEYQKFIQNPFAFLDRPELFHHYFDRAWQSNRAPGQIGAPIPDVARLIPDAYAKIARHYHYDFIDGAPSHYHVVRWAMAAGYRIASPKHASLVAQLADGMKRVKELGIQLTRPQESWVAVVQSLRPVELIPDCLYLNGPVWPQDNIGPENLWIYKPLHARAYR